MSREYGASLDICIQRFFSIIIRICVIGRRRQAKPTLCGMLGTAFICIYTHFHHPSLSLDNYRSDLISCIQIVFLTRSVVCSIEFTSNDFRVITGVKLHILADRVCPDSLVVFRRVYVRINGGTQIIKMIGFHIEVICIIISDIHLVNCILASCRCQGRICPCLYLHTQYGGTTR